MRSAVLAILIAVAATAATCATAGAAVYCVPAPTSSCTDFRPTLADAVTAANASSDADTIILATGMFTGGVTANYETHIIGAGRTSTRIDGGAGTYGVRLVSPLSSIRDLTIHEPAGGPTIGLFLSGGAQNVTVDLRDNPVNSSTAVILQDDGSFVDGAALNSLDTSAADNGISIGGSGDPLVSDVQVQGRYAITTDGAGNKRLRFIQATGDIYGLQAKAESTLLEDSKVVRAPVVSYTGIGATTDITTTVRHVTIRGAYVGVEAGHDGLTAQMNVSNTALVGGGPDPETPDVYVVAYGSAVGELNIGYSFFRDAHALKGMGGGTETLTRGAGNVDGANANLVDMDDDNLRPAWNSPLVDKGDPVPGGGEPMADLAGGDRTVNGVTDIGAYEYGRHAPSITALAEPSAVLAGDSVTFRGLPSDPDPLEAPTVTWSFDDGTTAAGPIVLHAFSTPGSHTVTATATDPVGLTATTVATVTVTPHFLPRKVLPPDFGFKMLRARKGVVPVALSCPVVGADCQGVVRLRLAGKKVELGRASYRIANGTHRTVNVRLTRSARKRLHRARHGLRITVVAAPTGANSKSKTVRLTGR